MKNKIGKELEPGSHGAKKDPSPSFSEGHAIMHLEEAPPIGKDHLQTNGDGRIEDDVEAEFLFGAGAVDFSLEAPWVPGGCYDHLVEVREAAVRAANVLPLRAFMGELEV